MFSRFLLIISWIISYSALSFSQTKFTNLEVWPQYYLHIPIKNKLSATADFSHRYSGLFESKTQWIARAGLNYRLTEKLSLSAGYAYSEYFTLNGVRRENRPWQQVQWNSALRKVKFSNRMRLEERILKDKNSNRFNYRIRYQFMVTMPVISAQRLSLYIADEPMINFGKQITGQMFDQNRLQAGLQIKLTDNLYLSPAYMYTYQYQQSTKGFRNINIIRTGLIYSKQ